MYYQYNWTPSATSTGTSHPYFFHSKVQQAQTDPSTEASVDTEDSPSSIPSTQPSPVKFVIHPSSFYKQNPQPPVPHIPPPPPPTTTVTVPQPITSTGQHTGISSSPSDLNNTPTDQSTGSETDTASSGVETVNFELSEFSDIADKYFPDTDTSSDSDSDPPTPPPIMATADEIRLIIQQTLF